MREKNNLNIHLDKKSDTPEWQRITFESERHRNKIVKTVEKNLNTL